jgi:putative flippase GtrA
MRELFDKKIFRFAAVGGLNAVFGYLAFAAMLVIGLNYGAASAVGTVVGILFNFKTTGSLVFESHDNRLIFRFVGVYLLVYGFNYLGLFAITRMGIDPYTAGLVTLLPSAGLAFALNSFLVFPSSR